MCSNGWPWNLLDSIARYKGWYKGSWSAISSSLPEGGCRLAFKLRVRYWGYQRRERIQPLCRGHNQQRPRMRWAAVCIAMLLVCLQCTSCEQISGSTSARKLAAGAGVSCYHMQRYYGFGIYCVNLGLGRVNEAQGENLPWHFLFFCWAGNWDESQASTLAKLLSGEFGVPAENPKAGHTVY